MGEHEIRDLNYFLRKMTELPAIRSRTYFFFLNSHRLNLFTYKVDPVTVIKYQLT